MNETLTVEMIRQAKATAIAGRPKYPVCYLCGNRLSVDELKGKKSILIPCKDCKIHFHKVFMRAIS